MCSPTWQATPPSDATALWAWRLRPCRTALPRSLPANRLRRGIVVTTTETGVHVDLYVVVEYGTNINTVSQNLIDNVTYVLTEYAEVPIDGVEVHVQGIKVRK